MSSKGHLWLLLKSVKECNEFLVKFGITSVHNYSKGQWKHLVKTKIAELNKDDLLTQIRGRYKKLSFEKLKDEAFKIKPYLSNLKLADARLRFKINCEMTPTVKMNFQSDVEYTHDMWACPGCSTSGDVLGCRDTQRHIMVCPGYDSFRQDKDLSQDKDIVQYFQEVIKHRLDNWVIRRLALDKGAAGLSWEGCHLTCFGPILMLALASLRCWLFHNK